MSINATLLEDMKTAMKAKDKVTLSTLRALKTAIKNAAILKGGADAELDDVEAMAIIRKQIKQRQDSIEQYQKADRPELVEVEQSEITVLEKYLPTPLSDEEITALVADAVSKTGATSRADMGKVIGSATKKMAGKADGKAISETVKRLLA